MFCSNCGKELSDSAKFCPVCGTKTANDAERSETGLKLVPAVCTNCGAPLTLPPDAKNFICPHCNTEFLVDEAINNYNINGMKGDVRIEHATVNVIGDIGKKRCCCPECGSPNVAKCDMVFKSGHKYVSYNTKKDSWTDNDEYKTEGVIETDLAREVAPPKSPTGIIGTVIGTGAFFAILLIIATLLVPENISPGKNNIVRYVFYAAFAYCLYINVKDAKTEGKRYWKRYEEWQNTWVCLACGNKFTPEKKEK